MTLEILRNLNEAVYLHLLRKKEFVYEEVDNRSCLIGL